MSSRDLKIARSRPLARTTSFAQALVQPTNHVDLLAVFDGGFKLPLKEVDRLASLPWSCRLPWTEGEEADQMEMPRYSTPLMSSEVGDPSG